MKFWEKKIDPQIMQAADACDLIEITKLIGKNHDFR